jgi:hypothetical protein
VDRHADYAAEHGMDLWAYTPPLSGAYDNPAKKIPDGYDHPGNTARLAALDAVAAEAGATRGHVVLARLLSRGIRPMLGGSKLDQLDSALDRAGLKLTGEQLQHLNAADQSSWSSPYARREAAVRPGPRIRDGRARVRSREVADRPAGGVRTPASRRSDVDPSTSTPSSGTGADAPTAPPSLAPPARGPSHSRPQRAYRAPA